MIGTKRKSTSTIDENPLEIKVIKLFTVNDPILEPNKKIIIIVRISSKDIHEISLQKQKDEILKHLGNIDLNDVQIIGFNGQSAYLLTPHLGSIKKQTIITKFNCQWSLRLRIIKTTMFKPTFRYNHPDLFLTLHTRLL